MNNLRVAATRAAHPSSVIPEYGSAQKSQIWLQQKYHRSSDNKNSCLATPSDVLHITTVLQ